MVPLDLLLSFQQILLFGRVLLRLSLVSLLGELLPSQHLLLLRLYCNVHQLDSVFD